MHIETLKIFCDLVELGSFSKTADKHFVSQSAVSQQIAQLELANNCQLLDRKYLNSSKRSLDEYVELAKRYGWIKVDE